MLISYSKAIERIREIVKEEGSQYAAAKRLDVSPQHLGEILRGTRSISDSVAKKIGYKRVVMFEREKEES